MTEDDATKRPENACLSLQYACNSTPCLPVEGNLHWRHILNNGRQQCHCQVTTRVHESILLIPYPLPKKQNERKRTIGRLPSYPALALAPTEDSLVALKKDTLPSTYYLYLRTVVVTEHNNLMRITFYLLRFTAYTRPVRSFQRLTMCGLVPNRSGTHTKMSCSISSRVEGCSRSSTPSLLISRTNVRTEKSRSYISNPVRSFQRMPDYPQHLFVWEHIERYLIPERIYCLSSGNLNYSRCCLVGSRQTYGRER